MKRHFAVFVLMFFVNKAFGQLGQCDTEIYIDEVSFYFNPSDLKHDTASFKLENENLLFVHLYTCEGKMDFSVKDTANHTILSGSYKDSPVLFYRYRHSFQGEPFEEKIYVEPYFCPIPDGKWTEVIDGVERVQFNNITVVKK